MSVTSFKDLPLADRDREWDANAADQRVRAWAGAQRAPNRKYRQAYVWYDGGEQGNFGAYKLPIADVVDGDLRVVPRAVMSAGAVIDGARGGVDVPSKEVGRVKSHLAKYYKKMDSAPPWETN
jgi:hypothetical protein